MRCSPVLYQLSHLAPKSGEFASLQARVPRPEPGFARAQAKWCQLVVLRVGGLTRRHPEGVLFAAGSLLPADPLAEPR